MTDASDHPTSPAPEPSNPTPEHSPSPHRRIFAGLVWLAVFLVVGFLVLSAWNVFRSAPAAYAILQISRKTPWIVFPNAHENDNFPDFETFGKAQVELAKSRPVLNVALRATAVTSLPFIRGLKDPIDWLQRKLDVTFDKDTGFMRFALRSGPPDARIILVNAATDAYLDEVVLKENDAKLRRLSKLKEFHLRSEEDVRNKKNVLKDMAKSVGGVNEKFLLEKQKLQQELVDQLRTELRENHSKVLKAQVGLALAERQKKSEDAAHFQAELEYLKEMGKSLQSDFEIKAKAPRDPGDKAVDLDFYQKELDLLDNFTQEVAKQKQRLEVEMDSPARIRVFQRAELEPQRNWYDILHDSLFDLW
jgi:hypothetical protein